MQFAAHEMPCASIMLPEIVTEGWDVTAKNSVLSVEEPGLIVLSMVNKIFAEFEVSEITWYLAAMVYTAQIDWIIKNIRRYCLMVFLNLFNIKITDIN